MPFWPLTSYSDFPNDQTFHQFHDLDTELQLHRITSSFHGLFATGVACQQGPLTLPFPFLGLAYNSIVETSLSELAMSFLDFSPWILVPLGIFSIMPSKTTCILKWIYLILWYFRNIFLFPHRVDVYTVNLYQPVHRHWPLDEYFVPTFPVFAGYKV